MIKNIKKKYPETCQRVFVGMSGGVDSSVSSYLLKKEGYDVTGVFIRAWEPAGYPCTWRAERREAMRVASFLDIPLLTIDLSREYKKRVVDYLLSEYKEGKTPNPDVMCNKLIKFGVFFDWAMTQGADFVATGHYAQNKNDQMVISKDKEKDQTYFLWAIEKSKLSKIIFPVGHLLKSEVRKVAEKAGLPNAEKKDSQGLCFVGQFDFKEFLIQEIGEKPGDVLDANGQIIGEHKGAYLFTNGERHGFKTFHKLPDEKPYYVTSKDLDKNTITVSPDAKIISAVKNVKLEKVNWLSDSFQLKPQSQKIKARVRYRQPLQNCALNKNEKEDWEVSFDKPQTIASGQSLVLYDKEICLGGGVIR